MVAKPSGKYRIIVLFENLIIVLKSDWVKRVLYVCVYANRIRVVFCGPLDWTSLRLEIESYTKSESHAGCLQIYINSWFEMQTPVSLLWFYYLANWRSHCGCRCALSLRIRRLRCVFLRMFHWTDRMTRKLRSFVRENVIWWFRDICAAICLTQDMAWRWLLRVRDEVFWGPSQGQIWKRFLCDLVLYFYR